MHKEEFSLQVYYQSCWRRHSHSSHFNVLTALLPLLILPFFDFHDTTFSWFSTSSQSPLKVHPYLVIITYQKSWRFVLGPRWSPHFPLQSEREENKEKTKRRPKKKGSEKWEENLIPKDEWESWAEQISKSKAHNKQTKSRRLIMTGRNINQHVAV